MTVTAAVLPIEHIWYIQYVDMFRSEVVVVDVVIRVKSLGLVERIYLSIDLAPFPSAPTAVRIIFDSVSCQHSVEAERFAVSNPYTLGSGCWLTAQAETKNVENKKNKNRYLSKPVLTNSSLTTPIPTGRTYLRSDARTAVLVFLW